MDTKRLWISFYTIVRKDFVRIVRIWPQTFLPSAITSALYFLIFGAFLGNRIGVVNGVPYINFVIPGLVMLAVVTNAYSNVATIVFQSKFFSRNIDEILVSPTPPWVIIAGFTMTGVVRGVGVGIVVLIVSLLFAKLTIVHLSVVLLFLILTSIVFSLAGLVNGIYAKGFDAITIVPTFILTPLVYLGGVFYSVSVLPGAWKIITHLNPIFYIINGFRFGFLGFADISLATSFSVLMALGIVLVGVNWYLIRTGLGLRQ
jgi:ABC-2 type transport system permease protein